VTTQKAIFFGGILDAQRSKIDLLAL